VLAGIETGVGSVEEILGGKFSFRTAPLVLANILAPIILRLIDAGLLDLVEEGGTIVFSGILDHQAQAIEEASAQRGFRFVEKKQINDWVAIAMQK